MKKRKRRIILSLLILLTAGTSYYFVEYSYKKEFEKLIQKPPDENVKIFENKTPSEVIQLIQEKIDSAEVKIKAQEKIIPYYTSSIQVYDKVIQTLNLLDKKVDVNIEKSSSEKSENFNAEKFQIKGSGRFKDLFSLINLFETSNELYKINLKEIKQTYEPASDGKIEEKVFFNLELSSYYNLNPDFNLDLLQERKSRRSVVYISDFFESLIKLEIPPNYEGLFETDGAKLLAILPDAVYLVDKKGNAFTLVEGDQVYLGYLTKIDYQNYACEFLLNKGGILERVIIKLDDKENLK